ncbi:hypothetical protein [Leisingera sp. M658]|uniref:hypothetical protein n=1 Tax=Leisingera sp. M658 TaxID=2867015 RepID=UPI0021A77D04|nr:hypothetical protein [Leisingera sp. M658]UWQ73925.1 hypothetical protein K3724_15425 [Leisingera sp. M658]
MADGRFDERSAYIAGAAWEVLGEEPREISAPGGKSRSSLRLHFKDRTVIATLRANFRRTHLEAFVLEQLAPHCDDIPQVLGVHNDVLFQSDTGQVRLSEEIIEHAPGDQLELAAEACAAIFRIQAAARKTELHSVLPHLGANRSWIRNFVSSAGALEAYSMGIPASFDYPAVAEFMEQPGVQFLKWDCRAGNAAIGDDGFVRWFDFEYAGLRHGAEDFAWLIGDETWPIAPDQMADVMIETFDPGCGHEIGAYLEYLSAYTALHCIQRLELIQKEVKSRGWLSQERVRKYDDAGVHPEFAAQLCRTGAYYAAQSKLTAPLCRNFEAAGRAFQSISGV